MPCPKCGGSRLWQHDQSLSKTGLLRVRAKCASSGCGHRFTIAGRVRDWQAEAERRGTFFDSLAVLTPLVGIVRARDRAIETSEIHFTTASHNLAEGTIGSEFRRYREAAEYYSMVEHVVRVYGLSQRKQSDFPKHDPARPDPPVDEVEPDLLWLLLSRARGIAALVTGLPRPAFGEAAPSTFPSWIDRGAGGVDPLRRFFPPSRHVCALEIVEHIHRTVVAETPEGYWGSHGARDWLRTKLRSPEGLLRMDKERWQPSLEELDQDRPPVTDPVMVLRILRREILHAKQLAADAFTESVDDRLRYWVETAAMGNVLRVRVTLGGRSVGRAEARLPTPCRTDDNAARLQLDVEDHNAEAVKLVVGQEKVVLPWREMAGADNALAERLVSPPTPAGRPDK
jgi:hypothetical protein